MVGMVATSHAFLGFDNGVSAAPADYNTVTFSSYNVLLNYGKAVEIFGVIFSTPSQVQGTNGEYQYVAFRATSSYTGTQLTGNTTDFSTNNEAFRIHQSTTVGTIAAFDLTPVNGGRFIPLPVPVRFPKGCAFKPSSSSIPRVTVLYRDLF